ncbi:hypothetical protein JZ751_012284, partial [Albula glossodonta]
MAGTARTKRRYAAVDRLEVLAAGNLSELNCWILEKRVKTVLAGQRRLGATMVLSQDKKKRMGLGAAVVCHLSQSTKDPNHKLYFDNCFTTYKTNPCCWNGKALPFFQPTCH